MADYIRREAAIQTLRNLTFDLGDQTDIDDIIDDVLEFAISAVERLVPAADVRNVPNNKVHLCDSCKHEYPDCPASNVDMLFGDCVGNDNICCCKCYVADVRPVVLCRDCKHFNPYPGDCTDGGIEGVCKRHNSIGVLVMDEDFCSDAERT